MDEFCLAVLPTEILEVISSHLDIKDLKALLESSSKHLYRKLALQGGIQTITRVQNFNSTFEALSPFVPRTVPYCLLENGLNWCPRSPYPYQHLTSFVWALTLEIPFFHFLPPTLTNLDIQSSSLQRITLPYIRKPAISDLERAPSNCTLKELFPVLRHLTLSHRGIASEPTWKSELPLFKHGIEFIELLPPSLESLQTCLFPPSLYFTHPNLLPPNLIRLSVSISTENGKTPTIQMKNDTNVCDFLHRLVRLDLPFLSVIDSSVFSLLGPHLETLTLNSIDIDAVCYLPQTLTHMTLCRHVILPTHHKIHNNAICSPENRFILNWPPNLRVFRQNTGNVMIFPPSIHTLQLGLRDLLQLTENQIVSQVLQIPGLTRLYMPNMVFMDSSLIKLPATLLEVYALQIKQTGHLVLPNDVPKVWSPGSAALCAARFVATLPFLVILSSIRKFKCDEAAVMHEGIEEFSDVKVLIEPGTALPNSLRIVSEGVSLSKVPVREFPPNLEQICGSLQISVLDLQHLPKTLTKVKSLVIRFVVNPDWQKVFDELKLVTLVYPDDFAMLAQKFYLPNLECSEVSTTTPHAPDFGLLPPLLEKLTVKGTHCWTMNAEITLPPRLSYLEIASGLSFKILKSHKTFFELLPNLDHLRLGGDAGKDFLYFGNSEMRLLALKTLHIWGCKPIMKRVNPLRDIAPQLTTLRLAGSLRIADHMLDNILPSTITHAEIDTILLTEEAASHIPPSLTSLVLSKQSSVTGDAILALKKPGLY